MKLRFSRQGLKLTLLIATLILVGCSTNFLKHSTAYKGSTSSALTKNIPPEKLQIALLLPSTGPYANSAKTIRNGFLAAYYQNAQKMASQPTFKIYDTGDGSHIREAYHQAIADKTNFIVGPLTKSELEVMAKMQLQIPVLALNTIAEDLSLPPGLYQFGLMPEDEVIAVANHALHQNKHDALVLAPKNALGARLVSVFQRFWQSQHGTIVDMAFFKSNQDLEDKLRALVQIDQKADMLFIVATPETARQIKSLLNLYDTRALPIYATASIYSGTPSPTRDQVLNGICFCDMPWILQYSLAIQEDRQSMEKISPNSASQAPRFFALGMDAYQLAIRLGNANLLPSYGLSGYTGNLHVNRYQRIERGLVCARFEEGVPVPDS